MKELIGIAAFHGKWHKGNRETLKAACSPRLNLAGQWELRDITTMETKTLCKRCFHA